MSSRNLLWRSVGALSILFAILSAVNGCVSPTGNAGAPFRTVALTTTGNSSNPDLVITDVSLDGCQVYYTIKNIGAGDAGPTTTNLYVNGILPPAGGTSYVDILKAGQEMKLSFSNYGWPWCSGGNVDETSIQNMVPSGSSNLNYVDPGQYNYTVRVCANAGNDVVEASTGNNCFTKILGRLVDYNLIPLAHLAPWTNGTEYAPVFGSEDNQYGAYIEHGGVSLEMVPNQVPQGWIQGTFGAFYSDTVSRADKSAAIKVPANLHFKASVGLADNAQGSDGVTFRFGIKDLGDTVTFLPGKKMTVPGQFADWDIDLSGYEGQIYYFILRVEAGNSPAHDFAIWREARLIQVSQ